LLYVIIDLLIEIIVNKIFVQIESNAVINEIKIHAKIEWNNVMNENYKFENYV